MLKLEVIIFVSPSIYYVRRLHIRANMKRPEGGKAEEKEPA